MFHELRLSLEHFAYSPKCPSFLKGIIYKVNTEMLKRVFRPLHKRQKRIQNSKYLLWVDLGESEQNF